MSEPNGLMQRIERVGASIDPNLTDRDVERLVEGARRRRRRRAIRRVGLGAVGVGVAAAVLAMGPWGRPLEERRTPAGVATVPAPAGAAPLRLADGSVATPLDDTSALVVREDVPERVAIDLSRGRGRFEVAPRPERLFSVHAGDVTVTVIGTIFTVERVADRIGVTVSRGKVLVEWAVGSRTLGAGESGWFPPLVVEQTGAAVAPPASRSAPAPAAPAGKKVRQRIARAASDGSEEAANPAPEQARALLPIDDGRHFQWIEALLAQRRAHGARGIALQHPAPGLAELIECLIRERRHAASLPRRQFQFASLLCRMP